MQWHVLEISDVQLKLVILWDSLNCMVISSIVERNMHVPSGLLWSRLTLRNIVLKSFNNFLAYICWETRYPLPIWAGLLWIFLEYQFMLTITFWHHLFEITSFLNFDLFNTPNNATVPTLLEGVTGLKCINWCTLTNQINLQDKKS